MLDRLPGQPSSVSLAVVDPLIFPGEWVAADMKAEAYDDVGYSSYARLVAGLLLHFLRRRDLAKVNLWTLRHLYALQLYAKDFLGVPHAASPVFGGEARGEDLKELISRVDQLAAYLLAEDHADGWLGQMASNLVQKNTTAASHGIEQLLQTLIGPHHGSDAIRESRVLRTVLQHLFAGASKSDADQFLKLARSVEKTCTWRAVCLLLL